MFIQNLEETLSIFGEKGTVVIGGTRIDMIKVWRFEDNRKEKRKI